MWEGVGVGIGLIRIGFESPVKYCDGFVLSAQWEQDWGGVYGALYGECAGAAGASGDDV